MILLSDLVLKDSVIADLIQHGLQPRAHPQAYAHRHTQSQVRMRMKGPQLPSLSSVGHSKD